MASPVELRVDPLSGDPVCVVAARQSRPNLPSSGCPFCVGGREAPEPYTVRSFPNRWPAMPGDRCEVVLYTPDHDATFASLGERGARAVVDLWADRTRALGARPDVDYVLVFENRGPAVGATIAHPHGQIYAYDHIPPRPHQELLAGNSAAALGDGPRGAATDRMIATRGSMRSFVPWAASWPFEVIVAPTGQRPDLPTLEGRERDDLAAALVDVVGRLDALFDAPMPYMMWIHQKPTDGQAWPEAWLHVHFAPIWRDHGTPRYVAGAEIGAGVYFNPVDPAAAADRLRAVTPAGGAR